MSHRHGIVVHSKMPAVLVAVKLKPSKSQFIALENGLPKQLVFD